MKKFVDDPQWMAQLLKDLQEFDNTPKEQVKFSTYEDESDTFIDEIPEELELKLYNLITDDVRAVDGTARKYLKDNGGFSIFPGDKDSFGWLTACIRFPKLDAIYVWG